MAFMGQILTDIVRENIILVSGIVLFLLFSIMLGLYSKIESLLIYVIITVFTALFDIIYRYRWLNENEFSETHATPAQNEGENEINASFSIIIRKLFRVILELVGMISYYTLFITLPIYGIILFISSNFHEETKVTLIILLALPSCVLSIGLRESLLHHFKAEISKFFKWRGVVKGKEPLSLIDKSNFLILYSFVLLTLRFG